MSPWDGFGELLFAHTRLVFLSLALALAIGVPLAVALVSRERTRQVVLGSVGVMQTVPGLALLALMVPIIAFFNERTGFDVPPLGFFPTIIALTIYSLLPILRNAVTGLMGVDPALIEAATALGMTRQQRLWRVEMPLAMPVIRAGVRTAAVWCVGTATLATPVGQACLGNPIFTGLHTRSWDLVLVGCFGAAVLAVALDQLLGRLPPRVGAAVILGGGLLSALPLQAESEDVIRVGSKSFTEQLILADLAEALLLEAGFEVKRVEGLGSSVAFDAIKEDELDLSFDYTGTLWTAHLKRTDQPGRDAVREQSCAWVAETSGARCLGSVGFENAYAMAARRGVAAARGWQSLHDLDPSVVVGGDYEFFNRQEWVALTDNYTLEGATQKTYDATLMYEALKAGEVDLISAYTTDGRIDAYDLVLLEDPEAALPPYEAVMMTSPSLSARSDALEALRPLLQAIDDEQMRAANAMVDLEGRSVGEAVQWLRGQMTSR